MASFEVIEDEGTRCVRARLDNEMIHVERGALSYMFGDIRVHANLPRLGWYVRSSLSEESLIRPEVSGRGTVYLESSFGGFHVIETAGERWILESGSYWASEGSVQLDVFRENMITSFWAGDGLLNFQTRASGHGKVVVATDGPVETIELRGEQLATDGRYVIARTEGISYLVRRVSRGRIRSRLAGEHLLRVYRGTGTILLCSYPYWRLRMLRGAGSKGSDG